MRAPAAETEGRRVTSMGGDTDDGWSRSFSGEVTLMIVSGLRWSGAGKRYDDGSGADAVPF